MDDAIKSLPSNSQLLSMRGSLKFRSGKIAESIDDFDKCIELNPEVKPYLWQRGIALYYADRFKDGLEQFAVHREVNPNDVENAFCNPAVLLAKRQRRRIDRVVDRCSRGQLKRLQSFKGFGRQRCHLQAATVERISRQDARSAAVSEQHALARRMLA